MRTDVRLLTELIFKKLKMIDLLENIVVGMVAEYGIKLSPVCCSRLSIQSV